MGLLLAETQSPAFLPTAGIILDSQERRALEARKHTHTLMAASLVFNASDKVSFLQVRLEICCLCRDDCISKCISVFVTMGTMALITGKNEKLKEKQKFV